MLQPAAGASILEVLREHLSVYIMLITGIFKVCAICLAFRKFIFLKRKHCIQQCYFADFLWLLPLLWMFSSCQDVLHVVLSVCKAYREI